MNCQLVHQASFDVATDKARENVVQRGRLARTRMPAEVHERRLPWLACRFVWHVVRDEKFDRFLLFHTTDDLHSTRGVLQVRLMITVEFIYQVAQHFQNQIFSAESPLGG